MRNLLFLLFALITMGSSAQSIKETFDSNYLDWTEQPKSYWGSAVIDKGVMTVQAKEHNDYVSQIETHCYMPISMQRPFTVISHVTIGELDDSDSQKVGMIFNYQDFGNYNIFAFNEYNVTFARWEKEHRVGYIRQGMKWSKKKKAQQEWKLDYDGQTLLFFVDDIPVFKVKNIELKYTGLGFYAEGKQKLIIDDVEIIQQ